jgi:hypothetical protein
MFYTIKITEESYFKRKILPAIINGLVTGATVVGLLMVI